MQKARRHPDKSRLRPLVGVRFQVLFTPLLGVLFTFPSRYWFTIGLSVVFSLTRWSWQIQTGFHVSRPTQDTTRKTYRYMYGTFTLCGLAFQNSSTSDILLTAWSYNPVIAETITVWAIPRSIATTKGITVVFFSSGYLDVSVPRVSFRHSRMTALWQPGCPIRKSTD